MNYVFGFALVAFFVFRKGKSSALNYAALGRMDSTQSATTSAIERAFRQYGDGDRRKLAYIIATAFHESRLRPIREIRAAQGTEVWKIQNAYWNTGFYGRGYAQLTWEQNYRKMGQILGVDLGTNPDLALQEDIAAKIIVIGMMRGAFTGKALGNYINNSQADYYNARRTVGAIMVAGTDTAALIQSHTFKIL